MQVFSYLFLDGKADQAIEFYRQAIGAKVEALMRFKESPEPPPQREGQPDNSEKVMHASLKIGDTTLFLSDGECAGKAKFEGFGLALTTRDEIEAKKMFSALSEGGQVRMPLAKTFFSPSFGMVADRFGVLWMVMAESKGAS
ncbi:VOC family protein [Eoetvoesiella caeni]|uniref:PhnB protein n=1 Tax=Eoetvoesiella caeni TaxID=645616 RepID=A0A366HM24_9BURK|nr:VOC family protein [Eoetvoesiella caeni]MCI2807325.1 VOC family protein [Eoetvoesiella caeni]NYT53280.1 VOC family protein [Eoetvoesiella caeni]RBP43261.1 PhnB protein [Eoetvoesiella caeni]